MASISVDEKSQLFAVIDSKRKVLCKAEEIIGLEFTPGTLAGEEAKYSKAKNVLAIETINKNLPRIQITPSMFGEAQLGETYVRLKKMQAGNKVITEAPLEAAAHLDSAKLEDAIRQLTDVVSSLTNAVKQLALKDGSPPPS